MEIILFNKVYSRYEKFIILFYPKDGQNFPVDLIILSQLLSGGTLYHHVTVFISELVSVCCKII